MSPQRSLSQRSLQLLERQLNERRQAASAMVEAFFIEGLDAQITADQSDRFDDESPIGVASDESFALAACASEVVGQIDEALQRMALGRYGSCLGCGVAISFERLKARPFTTRCIACKNLPDGRDSLSALPNERALA